MTKKQIYKVTYHDISSINNEVIVKPYKNLMATCYIIGEILEDEDTIVVKYGGGIGEEDNDSCFDVIPKCCEIKREKI